MRALHLSKEWAIVVGPCAAAWFFAGLGSALCQGVEDRQALAAIDEQRAVGGADRLELAGDPAHREDAGTTPFENHVGFTRAAVGEGKRLVCQHCVSECSTRRLRRARKVEVRVPRRQIEAVVVELDTPLSAHREACRFDQLAILPTKHYALDRNIRLWKYL